MNTNQLLNSIPRHELLSFEKKLDRVRLELHEVLIESNMKIDYVFFPQTCMISIVTPLENGSSIEAATVGNDGMIGLPLFLGLETSNTRALCQMAGECLRMRASDFKEAMSQSAGLRTALGLYTNALLAMVSQGSACNGLHSIEQRLARWILTISDRVGSDKFSVTQEFLAQMLGTHRPTLTQVAINLQNAGLITYSRGSVQITNRPGLADTACECYELIRELYEETFSSIQPMIDKVQSER
jgi:CRP-like cAMP-binding protein